MADELKTTGVSYGPEADLEAQEARRNAGDKPEFPSDLTSRSDTADQTDSKEEEKEAFPHFNKSVPDKVEKNEDQAPDWAPKVYDAPIDHPPFSPHTAEERQAQPHAAEESARDLAKAKEKSSKE